MRKGLLYVGAVLLLFGLLFLSLGVAVDNPTLGVVAGEIPLIIGAIYALAGLISGPKPGETVEQVMKEAVKICGVVIGSISIMAALIYAVITPSLRGWGLLIVVVMTLVVIGSWFAWIPSAIYWIFAFIYKMVEPRGPTAKMITAFASVLFGLLIVMLLGGPIGMFGPIWTNLLGAAAAFILVFLVGGFVILSKRSGRRDRRAKSQAAIVLTRQNEQTFSFGNTGRCCLCGKELESSYYACRSCQTSFCLECDRDRQNVNRCPNCGKLLKVDFHKGKGSEYVS